MKSLISKSILNHLQEIAEKLEEGHASVMIGAGFSKNADQKFPSWNDLGIAFYKKLNNREPSEREHFLNPMKLSGEIKEDFGNKTLFEIIKSNIPDKRNNQEIPDTIVDWEKICEDSEEFQEIRKQWKSL
jgi:hypothetical protein